ncbi:hypothetical protein JK635_07800 [Neobacillus sp. YIM B02564]|uniref:VWFA domain-containing protein n=1 Tax=Neobacillus paridis TaxID=2803862 RepID=A0ABS1TLR6_9BACI|nr:VWA domain-containing protein [Neobacillus paridis]MBL4952113.1 hypothetical protein [Neobacillus paridis]
MSIQNMMDDLKILMSGAFRSRSERYLRAVTGNYKNKLIFQPGQVCTDGEKVWADPTSSMIQHLPLVKKIIAVRGQIAHEAFHILFTDFSPVKKMAEEAKRADDETRFRIIQRKSYFNIVEDEAIEMAGCTMFPGLAPYIRLLNDTAFEKLPSLEEVEKKGNRLKAHQIACAQYGIIGRVKGKFSDPALIEAFEKSKPHLDKGRIAKTSADRQVESDALLVIAEPFIEEQILKGNLADLFENPKGDDVNESGNGQGLPMPNDPTEFRKSKPQPSTSNNEQSDENEESKEKGEESSSKGQNEKQSDEQKEKCEQSSPSGNGSSEHEKEEEADEDDAKGGNGSSDDEEKEEDEESNENHSGDDDTSEESGSDADQNGDSLEGDSQSDSPLSKSNQNSGSSELENGAHSNSEQDEENATSKETDAEETDEELEGLLKEMQKELEETMSEMEKEEAAQKQNQSREEEVKHHLRNGIKYSDRHKGIQVITKYDFSPSDTLKNRFERIQASVRVLSRNLTKKLQYLIRYNQEEKYTGLANGHLNQTGLWRKDGNIFYQKKEKSDEADLAVLVLVDESGSMQEHSRYEHAQKACVLLAEVCESLKIPFAVIGHNAVYQQPIVEHQHYIVFEKPIKDQKANLARINYKQNTREGVSLKYACEYLMKQPQKDRLLIVISDGEPFHSINGSIFSGKAAQVDAALVVEEYQKKGITTIGCAIGNGQDKIASIYKNYISIPRIEQLPTKLVKLLQKKIFKD